MADQIREHSGSAPGDFPLKWIDKGDHYAPLHAIEGTVTAAPAAAAAATETNVASSATVVTLAAAGTRVGIAIYNDAIYTLYIKLGAGASSTSFSVKLAPQQFYEMPAPAYQGLISGIWEAADASGAARVTELT